MVELKVLGISLQGDESSPMMLLHPQGTNTILSISIGPSEAFAISSLLSGPVRETAAEVLPLPAGEVAIHTGGRGETVVSGTGWTNATRQAPGPRAAFPRPSTHDLALDMVLTLGGRLLAVEILKVLDGVFIAEAVLSTGSAIRRVDCRPSDGVALALRCGALIRASDAVLAYAEEIENVLPCLPEHVRSATRSCLEGGDRVRSGREAGSNGYDGTSFAAQLPLALEAALAVSDKYRGKARTGPAGKKDHRARQAALIPPIRLEVGKILKRVEEGSQDEGGSSLKLDLASREVAEVLVRQAERLATGKQLLDGESRKSAKIKISLIRQSPEGDLEILDEVSFKRDGKVEQADNAADYLTLSNGTGLAEAARQNNWAELLEKMDPETKALM